MSSLSRPGTTARKEPRAAAKMAPSASAHSVSHRSQDTGRVSAHRGGVPSEILVGMNAWPAAEPLDAARVRLEPLTVQHAREMVDVLALPAIYEHIGGAAPSAIQLEERYSRQVAGHSADGRQGWLNWIVRRRDTNEAIGFTQATLTCNGGNLAADVAWVVAPRHQGAGFATEAAKAMCGWLRSRGVGLLVAHISPANDASIGVAHHLGMHLTEVIVDEENRWECSLA